MTNEMKIIIQNQMITNKLLGLTLLLKLDLEGETKLFVTEKLAQRGADMDALSLEFKEMLETENENED